MRLTSTLLSLNCTCFQFQFRNLLLFFILKYDACVLLLIELSQVKMFTSPKAGVLFPF